MNKAKKHFTPGDLRVMRKSTGLTQRAVAVRMGVEASTVSMIETGKNSNPITIALYLRVLETANAAQVDDQTGRQFSLEAVVVAAGAGAVFGALVLAGATALFV